MRRNLIIFSSIALLFFISNIPISGEFKLKTYDDYKNNLDKVYDSAKFKQNETDWERFVNSGIETLKAKWIADAEIEIKAELDQQIQATGIENAGKIKSELDLIFNENLTKFNADSQKEKLTEKGVWLADVISLLMPSFNRKAIDDVVESKKTEFNSKAINDAFDSWQNEVGTVYNSLSDQYGISTENSKQSTLQSALALAWMKDEALQGFTDELTKRFADLKNERLRLEEIYVIKKRNTYFYERTTDTDSLKRESESQSAEAVASVILSEASGKADDIMSGALFVSLVEDSATGLPLTLDESEQRIKNFIDAGLSSWRQAEEAMLGARLDWERKAFRNYDSADDVWKQYYEKLTKAKSDWLAKARAQIFEGNLLWQAKFNETDANYETAINNLDKYIDAQNETWDDYSSGVRQMIVTGSSALSAAAENLAWLTGYRNELAGLSDATSAQLLVKADAQILEWKNTIASFKKILASSELQYHSVDMNDLLTDGRLNPDGTEAMRNYYYSDGTNVLINGSYAVSNDPYLMTSDEFELELLKIEKAYWEERKNRTSLVYDYAVNETSRLSKDEQLAKLESAKLDLAAKKSDYEKAISSLSTVILPALDSAKNDMKTAADEFANARRIYDLARAKYEEAMNTVYILSSPDAMRIAVDDMNEAVNTIASLSNRINDKESEWLLRAKDYYGALSVQEKSESAALYAQRLKAAIEIRDGIDSANGYRNTYQQFEDIVLKNGNLSFSGSNFDTMISSIDSNKDVLFKTVTPPVLESENFVTYMKDSSEEVQAARNLYETNRNSYYTLQNLITNELYKDILFQYTNGSIKSDADLQNSLTSILSSCADQTSSSCTSAINIFSSSINFNSEQKVKAVLTENASDANKTKEELTKLFYQGLAKIYPNSEASEISDSMSESELRDYVVSLASKELLNRKTILQSSVITALNSVKKAKDVSDEIVRYLLTDMSIVGNSNDTLAKINERLGSGNKNLPTEKAKANIEIATGVKDFLNNFSGDTDANLYNRMISSALTAINNSNNTTTASKNIEIYNYIKNLKPSIIQIEKVSTDSRVAEYDKLLAQSDKTVSLLNNIKNFYSVEIYGLTEKQVNDKFTEYKNLILTATTDAEKEKFSAYIMELTNPGYFNNFFNTQNYISDTYSELGKVSALSAYAAKYYSNSFEKTANLKAKGVTGIIADILGLTPSDTIITEIKSGGITYAKLKEYGTKLTSFVKGDEYGSLPVAIRKSIEETVSSFKSMIRAREIYETVKSGITAAELKAQKEKYQDLAASAESIMGKLSDILNVKKEVLNPDSGESFSNPDSAGKILTSLEKLSADIESFTAKINEAEFGEGFNFSLTGDLQDIRTLKDEVYAYTKAYEYITGGSLIALADYQSILLGQNVNAEIVEKIGSIITKYNIKNNIINDVTTLASVKTTQDLSALEDSYSLNTPAGITSDEYKVMYESLINEVYADSINAIVGTDENFNAMLVDASFRDYGMSLHFQDFIRKKFINNEFKSFEDLFGKIEAGDVFVGGDFANLAQYSSSSGYLKSLSESMKKIYFTELSNSLSRKILPDNSTVETYQADNYPELVLHFEKYIEKNYSSNLDFDAYLTGFQSLYIDTDPFKVEITNNSSNLEGVYNGLLGKNLTHSAEFLNGNKAGAYLIEKDYYSALLNSITYNSDFMEIDGFVSIYNMNLNTSPALASIKDELTSYGNILKIAYDYNRNGAGDIEKFLKDKNITDPREENFLRLFAIDPNLASPEYLMDTTGETDLALSSSLMKTAIETMFSHINTGVGKAFFDKLPIFGANKSEAAWLKGEALDAIEAGNENFKHYRDFIQTAQNKYEVYFNPNDRFQTTAMDLLILSKNSSLRQAENPAFYVYKDTNGNNVLDAGENQIDYFKSQHRAEYNARIKEQIIAENGGIYPYQTYVDGGFFGGYYVDILPENIQVCSGDWMSFCTSPYAYTAPSDAEIMRLYELKTFNASYFIDTNSNAKWDIGEKTISEFYNEFKLNGYGLHLEAKTVPVNADEIVSDLIHSNMMQYFEESRANELVEEMTMFNRSLLKMVASAEIEVKDISQIQIRKELMPNADGTFNNYNFAQGGDFGNGGLVDSITLVGKITQIAFTHIPGSQEYRDSLKNILNEVYIAQKAPNTLMSGMADEMLARMQQAEAQLSESKQKIKENGAVLRNPGIEAYLKSAEYITADANYYSSDSAFKAAQSNNKNKLDAYADAKNAYSNHLEIISILFNKLETARIKAEDEQAVYDYASTAYLYTTGTGVSNTGTDTIKSDAFEDFNQAKTMHEEIVNTYNEVLVRAEQSVLQSPMSDATYAKLAAELKEKSERAYRLEKTKVLMDREIKARSFEYEQAKVRFEKARDSIFPVTGESKVSARNNLADKFMESKYINEALYNDAIQMSLYSNIYSGMPPGYTTDNVRTPTYNDPYYEAILAEGNLKDTPMLEYYNMVRGNQILSNANLSRTIGNYQKYKEFTNIADNIYKIVLPITIALTVIMSIIAALMCIPVYGWMASGPFWAAAAALSVAIGIQMGVISDNNNKANSHLSMFNSDINSFKLKLNNMQKLKIDMYKKQASLAEFTQIQSLDDESSAGVTKYYDPSTGKVVEKKKYTLKGAFREISNIYGYEDELTEDDLKYITDNNDGDNFNIENYKSASMVMDEKGDFTESEKIFYNASEISKLYSDHLEKKRQDKLKEYYAHTLTMQKAGYNEYTNGYDKVIIGKANEKLFYEIFSETGEEKYKLPAKLNVSDEVSARAFNGYTKAAIEYFGAIEGYNIDALLDIESKTGNAEQLLSTFKQYDDSFIGLAEMELAQKKALQQRKWEISRTQLSDKKARWDALTQRILTRGVEQWGTMDATYREKWKKWRVESEKGIVEGQKAWDAKWTALKDKKVRWFENISKDISEEDMKSRLADITNTANSFTADVNERYGNIITNEDVNAVLADIMKDSPSLLSQDMLDRIKDEDMKFAMTSFSNLKADTVLYGTFSELMNKYENDIQKTRNLKLIDALTKLLGTLADRILEADSNASDVADNYAAGQGYSRDGSMYTSRELLTQQIAAYRQFNFTRSLLVPDSDMNKAVIALDNLPDWQYESMLGILMKQAKINFESVMDEHVSNSLPAHIGNFAQIAASSNFFVGLIGLSDINGGSGEYGRLSREIGTQRNNNAAIMGSMKLVKTVVSIFSGYGAIAIGAVDTMQSVATGELSIDEGGFEAGKSGLKGVLSGLASGLLQNVPYVGPIVSAGINIGIGGIKYSKEGGFGYRVTAQDAIMAGVSMAGDYMNLGINDMTGGNNPTASQFAARSASKFGTSFMLNTLAGGIKYDASGNPVGYGFNGLNAIDGLVTATSGLITGYATNPTQNGDYSRSYALAAGSKFLSGLLKGALYETVDAVTGQNNTAGMGLNSLSYSFAETVGFTGSFYGNKLGKSIEEKIQAAIKEAEARKRADENDRKYQMTAAAVLRPDDENPLEQMNRKIETKKYLDDKVASGKTLTNEEKLMHFELKTSLGVETTDAQKHEYQKLAKELGYNLTDRFINTTNGIMENDDRFNNYLKLVYGKPKPTFNDLNAITLKHNQGPTNIYINNEFEKIKNQIRTGYTVDEMRNVACVSIALYAELKIKGANVGDYSDFMVENMKDGKIGLNTFTAEPNAIKIVNKYSNIDGEKFELIAIRDFNTARQLIDSGSIEHGIIYSKNLIVGHSDVAHATNFIMQDGQMLRSDAGSNDTSNMRSKLLKSYFEVLWYLRKI